MNNHRNYFSHYYYDPEKISNPRFLNFPVAGQSSYVYLLGRAAAEARQRFKNTINDDDFDHIYKTTTSKEETTRTFYNLSDERNVNLRTVFILCLFLGRKDATLLISKIFGLKDTRTPKAIATRETLLQFCCKIPHPKLESSELWLDMLNELNRIPGPLYEAIAEDDRRKIEWQSQSSDTTTGDGQPPILRRHRDRFPYFALRFFDDTNYLNGIQFQIYLGQLCVSKYPKLVNGIPHERRVVKDLSTFGVLSDYRRQRDIPESWLIWQKIEAESTEDEVVQNDEQLASRVVGGDIISFAPQYQITDDRIAFTFHDNDGGVSWPTWVESEKKGKRWLAPQHLQKPVGVLHVNELANLFMYAWLGQQPEYQQHVMSPAEFLRKYIERIQSCIADAQSGKLHPQSDRVALGRLLRSTYDIKLSDLPDIVASYLAGKHPKDATLRLLEKVKNHIAATAAKLDEAQKQSKLEKGKRKKGLTKGKIGMYVAKDIVRFMAHDIKPNDFHYAYLQRYCALWGTENIRALSDLIKDLKIAGKDNHLFFHRNVTDYEAMFKQRAIERSKKKGSKTQLSEKNIVYTLKRFYEDYLADKLSYLHAVESALGSATLPLDECSRLMHIFNIKTKSSHNWNYADLHIPIPRGIFTVAIERAIQNASAPVVAKAKFASRGYNTVNPAYVISALHPNVQQFYKPDRQYDLRNINKEFPEKYIGDVAKWRDELGPKLETANYRMLYNKIDKNEKDIRHVQKTDRLLWQMVTIYVRKMVTQEGARQMLEGKLWGLENVGTDDPNRPNLLDEKVDMKNEVHGITITAKLAIKQYGAFRRLLYDKRLPRLFEWFAWLEKYVVEKSTIEEELAAYDAMRTSVQQRIFAFEKIVIEKMSADEKKKEIMSTGEQNRIEFKRCLAWVFRKRGITSLFDDDHSIDPSRICAYRNSLAHNDFPSKLLKRNQLPPADSFPESVLNAIMQNGSQRLLTPQISAYITEVFDKLHTEAVAV